MWRNDLPKQENKLYREMIDELVNMVKTGQGQIGSNRAKEGIWNKNAKRDGILDDQYEYNKLLKKLDQDERLVLARLLEEQVKTGVFETLKALENKKIKPFDEGYEGSPFEDFIGRMNDWEWPDNQ